jgi:hypothetical protein
MIHEFTAAGSSFAASVLLMGIRDLTSDERSRFTKLVRPSDLCGGGHIGTDPTPHDGVLEMLRADCGDGRVAILVASGNPTFTGGQARQHPVDWLHARIVELEKTARTSKWE